MNGNGRARLDKLAMMFRTTECTRSGAVCLRTDVVGDGTDDPEIPPAPMRCERCGRPVRHQVVVLAGVDASGI